MDRISNSGEAVRLSGAFHIGAPVVPSHVDELVRESVESTLNRLLNAEDERLDTRADS